MEADIMNDAVMETQLPLPLLNRGKVRDIYEVGDDRLLIVTTDRLSAFDVILPNPIPLKGKVLTQISLFWFEKLSHVTPHHLITAELDEMGLPDEVVREFGSQLRGRSMLVKRTRPLPVECVVRGYVAGSGWKDYQRSGAICGHDLPAGMKQCEKIENPIFTPATKETEGHDINIDREEAKKRLGADIAGKVERISIDLYRQGREFAETKGILIADTKFEFGLLDEQLILIDEALTPDSSRFWPKDRYEAGHDQPSYDKQIVRNYLEEKNWNKQAPAPELPQDVILRTSRAYLEVYERLTGRKLEG